MRDVELKAFMLIGILLSFILCPGASAQQGDVPAREELLEQSRKNPPANVAQNQIAGTEYRLFNGTRAREASAAVVNARKAIQRCDLETFSSQNRVLYAIWWHFESILDQGAWGEIPVFDDRDAQDRETIEKLKTELQAEWDNRQCDEGNSANQEQLRKDGHNSIMDEMPRDSWRPSKQVSDEHRKLEKREISQDVAVRKLREKIEDLEKRKKKIDVSFEGKNAGKSLNEAFSRKGVEYAKRNADAWGSSIWVSWEGAGSFYDTHKNKLHESIKVVQRQGGRSTGAFKTLEAGFGRWQRADKEIFLKLQEITNLYAELGMLLDARQDLNEQAKSNKCGFGGEREICEPLKQKIEAKKAEMDEHNKSIKAKKAAFQDFAAQIHFDVLGEGEVAGESSPESCPEENYSCEWKEVPRENLPDFAAMIDEFQSLEREQMQSCPVGRE